MEQQILKDEPFDADVFVQRLLDEGGKIPCDESSAAFNENIHLPHFYNKTTYKRSVLRTALVGHGFLKLCNIIGQKFFIDNIFVLLYGKFLGLLTILAIPSILRVLAHTKMSGSPMTAYRRYLATVFHMWIWYQNDFAPGSTLWKSIVEVRNKHNSASKRCCSAGLERISQKDMVFTQFGFMGYALAKREKIGLFNVDDEDLRAFVHVWRVIGFIIGIENRFNICRDSVEETTEICKRLADNVFKPAMENKDKEFLEMAAYLADGMWAMNPTLNANIYLNLAYRVLQTSENNNLERKRFLIELNFLQKGVFYFLVFTMWSVQFTIVKLYHNYTQYISMWLMKFFPFLAYYKFGYENSHVYVLENNIKSQ